MATEYPRGRRGQARVAIIAVIPAEMDAALTVLGANTQLRHSNYFVLEARPDREYPLVVTRSGGRGNVPASQAVARVIEAFRPAHLILVGTAGGLDRRDKVDLGDVVVANYISYSEFTKNTPEKEAIRHEPYDHPSLFLRAEIADPLTREDGWSRHIPQEVARPSDGKPKAVVGNIVAGEKIHSDRTNPTQIALLERFDAALAVDTESYGFASGVFDSRRSVHYNPQCLVVRGISDIVEGKHPEPAVAPGDGLGQAAAAREAGREPDGNNDVRKKWSVYASYAAASFVKAVVDSLFEPEE